MGKSVGWVVKGLLEVLMGRSVEVFGMSVFLVLSAVLAIVVVGTMISVSVSFCGVILSTTDLVAINWGGGCRYRFS